MLDDTILGLRHQLAVEILRIADQTHVGIAARVFGIDLPRLSDLRRGRLHRFSLERLIRILATVDRRVDITVRSRGSEQVRWMLKLGERARRRRASLH